MNSPIATPEAAARVAAELWKEKARRLDAKPESMLKFKTDPLGFVKWAWRWGLPGALEKFKGPDTWQEDFLIELGEEIRARKFDGFTPVDPIKMSRSAGKGVGKSAMVGMLTTYIEQVWPYCQGTVTANTFSQLETKTWAGIQHWFKTSRGAGDFLISATGIRHRIHGKSWQCSPQTCREENSEAFAGQHAANSVQFYIFDESSSIVEKIWEVAESGMVDGMPMFFAFGNPTRSSGKFYRINFGAEKTRWKSKTIDARECLIPNQKTLAEEIEYHGEDSDYARVYIKGIPPNAGDMQFIDSQRVHAAQRREPEVLDDEPLVAGVDLARGGRDKAVVRFRRGKDAKTIKPIKIPGEEVRDSTLLIAKLADLATQKFGPKQLKVTVWFLDGGGIGGPIIDRLKQLGHDNFVEIQFGGACPDPRHYANMRVWMWSKMRDWLGDGCIDSDQDLEGDLTNVGLAKSDNNDRLLLESKSDMAKRGISSPDDGDGLALTFARPVAPKASVVNTPPAIMPPWGQGSVGTGWMGG